MPAPSSLVIEAYETLRAQVVAGHHHIEGLAALRYHGMLPGLAILLAGQHGLCPPAQASHPPPLQRDSPLVRQLANLVLHTYSELTHVC